MTNIRYASAESLRGPVYVPAGESYSFSELVQGPAPVRDIIGPVYLSGDNVGHNYSEVMPRSEVPKGVSGPVYLTEEARHKYSQFLKSVDSLKTIAGPVYLEGDIKHNFDVIEKHVEAGARTGLHHGQRRTLFL